MKITTNVIQIELDAQLNEQATIYQNEKGLWGYTTTRGIDTFDNYEEFYFKSFKSCLKDLEQYEKNSLRELRYR